MKERVSLASHWYVRKNSVNFHVNFTEPDCYMLVYFSFLYVHPSVSKNESSTTKNALRRYRVQEFVLKGRLDFMQPVLLVVVIAVEELKEPERDD